MSSTKPPVILKPPPPPVRPTRHSSSPALQNHSQTQRCSKSQSHVRSTSRHSTSKSPTRHSLSRGDAPPLPPAHAVARSQSLPLPPAPARSPIASNRNMMMYSPSQWGGMQGMGGMGMQGMGGMGYNPYMMMGQQGLQGMGMGGMPGMSAMGQDASMKPYDSSKMKQGRMGHYGYLEGRELAGPPVGYMPAGVASPIPGQSQPSSRGGPASVAQGQAPSTAYYPGTGGGSAMAWGDPGAAPRARYDGASSAAGYVQADLDTPYPQTAGGGTASAWTRYGADGKVLNGVDGRMGINHRRMREGRV